MKIYTKTGDGGETSLFGGGRVPKDDARVEAYGAVDELNAAIGLARALAPAAEVDSELARIQAELFAVGAELATPHDARAHGALPGVRGEWAEALERRMDRWDEELPPSPPSCSREERRPPPRSTWPGPPAAAPSGARWPSRTSPRSTPRWWST